MIAHLFIAMAMLLLRSPAEQRHAPAEKELSQFTHQSWTTDDGLPQNSVNAMAQTADGYLWLGTQEGLARFDGVQFTTFDKHSTPELKNNFITALLVDRKDHLWIATYEGGLVMYNGSTFRSMSVMKKFQNSYIRTMTVDRNGTMWFAVRGNGIVRCDTNSVITMLDTASGLPNNEVRALYEDAEGRMWIGTEEGLVLSSGGRLTLLTTANGLADNFINAIIPAGDSAVWIGTNAGVQCIPLGRHTRWPFLGYGVRSGLPHGNVYSLATGPDGALWIGTRMGLARIANGRLSALADRNGNGNAGITAVLTDRENNVWVGFDGGGLEVFRSGLFTTYTAAEGLPSNNVWTIFEDAGHSLWIGTEGGVAMMDGGHTRPARVYTQRDGLYDNEVYSIGQDAAGAIWVGTVNGLNKIDHGRVLPVPPVERTRSLVVSCILRDSKGRMWVSTAGSGVMLFDKGRATEYTTRQGLASNYTNALYEDRSGKIYIGTDGEGISVIGDSGITAFTTKDGLTSNIIHAIYCDKSGTMWIGTFGSGLNRIKNGAITAVTSAQGLFDDVIFNIMEDDAGRLWMTSNKGIFHVSREELDRCADGTIPAVHCTAYGKESGLKSVECNGGVQPAGWRTEDGTLWFPTAAGVAAVDPAAIAINTTPPLVVIESAKSDERTSGPGTDVVLPPGNERLEIHFTGLSFVNPHKINFKVKLEGYDDEWEDVRTRRTAYYTHLPPGTYRFHVIAANSDGVWNDQGAVVTVVQSANFYETSIFYFGLAIIGIVGVYGFYRFRTRTLRQREHELQRLVEERTMDLRKEQTMIEELLKETERQREKAVTADTLKTKLVDMVAHHLKSPLISIRGMTNELEQSSPLNNLGQKYLKMIRFGTDRMVALINNLLNLSIIESGEIGFTMERHSLADLAGMIIDSYKFQAARKEQVLTYVADEEEDLTVNADSSRLQDAIENLVSNAVKYSPVGATIRAGAYRYGTTARFWITDTGPGIAEEERAKLFKKFQTLSSRPTGGESATGLGLAIVKEIVDRHHGSVSVKSELGAGSTFIIELPAV